ncbi:MAG: PHP domain-containing protein [Lentisphaeria bacterium]|nr:PHP domain-containing protein [Lentisphaeria bacterium]
MAANYNLHLHTHWSYDGEVTPETYLKRATELGMRCIAFTDHNTIDVRRDMEHLAPQFPHVQVVLGAEFDVDSPIGAHHILAYGFSRPLSSSLGKLLATYRERDHQQAACLCQGMQAQGFDFSEEDLKALLLSFRPEHVVSAQGLTPVPRRYLRDYFVRRGFLKEGEEVSKLTDRVLDPSIALPTADRVIPALKESGALVAVAHPTVFWRAEGRVIVDFSARYMDRLREAFQIDGVECAHMPSNQQQACRAYCIRQGLFSVAGSDLHRVEAGFDLGGHGGSNDWLDEFLERL